MVCCSSYISQFISDHISGIRLASVCGCKIIIFLSISSHIVVMHVDLWKRRCGIPSPLQHITLIYFLKCNYQFFSAVSVNNPRKTHKPHSAHTYSRRHNEKDETDREKKTIKTIRAREKKMRKNFKPSFNLIKIERESEEGAEEERQKKPTTTKI